MQRLPLHFGFTDSPESQDSEPATYPDGYTEAIRIFIRERSFRTWGSRRCTRRGAALAWPRARPSYGPLGGPSSQEKEAAAAISGTAETGQPSAPPGACHPLRAPRRYSPAYHKFASLEPRLRQVHPGPRRQGLLLRGLRHCGRVDPDRSWRSDNGAPSLPGVGY